MSKKYLMHVISGTHWDREWRFTAEQSKLRLVGLIDSTIHILEKKESYKCYCIDGGTIVIEDYLTIRPENRERLKRLIEAGRIQLVNWYTLPDTFTVAPEALIRNLLLGTQMAKSFGGGMESGYTATSYGQTSQLPQIYLGFGIKTAIFYRGMNKHAVPSLFLWEGKDGSRLYTLRTFDEVTRTNWFFYVHQPLVLGKSPRNLSYKYSTNNIPVHLCDGGLYERPFILLREEMKFDDSESSLKAALDFIKTQALPYAVGKHMLALNMEDNDRPFKLLPEMIEALNKVSPDIEIIQNSLDGYMSTVIEESNESKLFLHKGELRYPAVEEGFNALLGATHSSRVKLKILNEYAETMLINLAEPIASLASFYGFEYPRTNLDRSWKSLLQNHAHDSICGAAVDQAHEDMLYRFSESRMVAEEVTARGIVSLFNKINSAKDFHRDDHTITLFNTLNFSRKEVVPLIIDLPEVGSAGGVIDPCTGVGGDSKEIDYFDIIDSKGNKIEYEVLSKEKIQMAVERELDTSTKFPAVRRRILLNAVLPEMGYVTYALRPRAPIYAKHPEHGPDRKIIARENGVLENEYLKVQINHNGTFSLHHKQTGTIMENLHYFTDEGEVGSAHLRAVPQRNPIHTSSGCNARITLVETSLLRGIYRIDLTLSVPAAATLDGRDRLREIIEVPISYWLTLEKGSKCLKIKTRLTNRARDHRLRVNFPTGIYTDYATVESAFAVEKRCIRWTESGDNYEKFYSFQPMQNFVDVNNGQVGLAVLNKGLREYEVIDDKQRTIAITLLRTHRAYMTANTDMTPEEFDKHTGLHSFGELEYRYALYPHTGEWDKGGVLQAAYQHKVDIKAIQGVPQEGELPTTLSFFSIQPADKLMLSALKQSEDGKGIVLRIWNTSSEKQAVTIKTSLPVNSATSLRLDETPISEMKLKKGELTFEIKENKIQTILFK